MFFRDEVLVALFARAWIEINCHLWRYFGGYVALFARAWIEILTENQTLPEPERRPLCEGVD